MEQSPGMLAALHIEIPAQRVQFRRFGSHTSQTAPQEERMFGRLIGSARQLGILAAASIFISANAFAGGGADTGVQVRLPIVNCGDPNLHLPSNFVWDPNCVWFPGSDVPACGWGAHLVPNPGPRGILDFGGENRVYDVARFDCPNLDGDPVVAISPDPLDRPHVLLNVTGYFPNLASTSRLFGLVKFRVGGACPAAHGPIMVALQKQSGPNWIDIATQTETFTCGEKKIMDLEAEAPSNTNVRFQVRLLSNFVDRIDVLDARLFGAECFVDTSNPEMMCVPAN
jgi:hypothetical protein